MNDVFPPITPMNSMMTPEHTSMVTMTEAQPIGIVGLCKRSKNSQIAPTSPAPPMSRPSTEAMRSGVTEKFRMVDHSRSRLFRVYPDWPSARS